MSGFSREVARRIFVEELKNSNLSFRDGEDQHQYAPQYLLTPTGARCNRVFMVGTLTERDDIGGDTEYWRGRLVDPTGSILIYAGQYQPEAAQVLAGLEPPAFVAVVGKPNLYQTEDGNVIISIRAEAIQRADEVTRNRWILESARQTHDRLKALEATGLTPLPSSFSTADKAPAQASPSMDMERARQHYNTDITHYKQMVVRALVSLRSDLEGNAKNAVIEAAAKDIPVKPEKKVRSKSTAKEASLSSFPEHDEEVETISMVKKS